MADFDKASFIRQLEAENAKDSPESVVAGKNEKSRDFIVAGDNIYFKDFASVLKVLSIIADDKNNWLGSLSELFFMNMNLMFMKDKKLTYFDLVKKFTDSELPGSMEKKVIVTGNGDAAASVVSFINSAKIILPMLYEIKPDQIEKLSSTYEKAIDSYRKDCNEKIDILRTESFENEKFRLIECYSPEEVPWLLFWMKFHAEGSKKCQYVTMQVLLDSKDISQMISSDKAGTTKAYFQVPGLICFEEEYNQWIRKLCNDFRKRMDRLRAYKKLYKDDNGVKTSTIFIDVVKYTRYSPQTQKKIVMDLNCAVTKVLFRFRNKKINKKFKYKHINDKLTISPTGDGMAITLILNNPGDKEIEGPINHDDVFLLAQEIYKETVKCFKKIPLTTPKDIKAGSINLRLGVHPNEQEDFMVVDANGQINIVGPGINKSQRVMSFGDKGQFVVSKRYKDDIRLPRHAKFGTLQKYLDKHWDEDEDEHEHESYLVCTYQHKGVIMNNSDLLPFDEKIENDKKHLDSLIRGYINHSNKSN